MDAVQGVRRAVGRGARVARIARLGDERRVAGSGNWEDRVSCRQSAMMNGELREEMKKSEAATAMRWSTESRCRGDELGGV